MLLRLGRKVKKLNRPSISLMIKYFTEFDRRMSAENRVVAGHLLPNRRSGDM